MTDQVFHSPSSLFICALANRICVTFPLCFAYLCFIRRLRSFVRAGNVNIFYGRMNCAIYCSLVVRQTIINVPRLLLIGIQPSFSDQCGS